VDFQTIDREEDFEALCHQVATAPFVGLDTEFISENSYRPELCLIQVAVGEGEGEERLAVVDPLALPTVEPFWRAVLEREGATVIHGGREEVLFAWRATGQVPPSLVDLQVAAALSGYGYPLGYGPLVQQVLGRKVASGEARTDWRRRPLSQQQLSYAVDDVRHLAAAYGQLRQHLETRQRAPWLAEEMAAWTAEVVAGETASRWRRTKGAGRLPRRALAVLKALWHWRDARAESLDRPPRRVLRDDLLVELARRGSGEPDRIRSIRGMERGDYQRLIPEMAGVIRKALETPPASWPAPFSQERESPRLKVLTQILSLALQAAAEDAGVAASLVGTLSDLRALIRHREGEPGCELPRLAQGWRAEVVGSTLEEVLDGRVALRIRDAQAGQPLAFESWPRES
jgi:ribonuclease D